MRSFFFFFFFFQNIEELNTILATVQYETAAAQTTDLQPKKPVSRERKLFMCAQELVDTERLYGKVGNRDPYEVAKAT